MFYDYNMFENGMHEIATAIQASGKKYTHICAIMRGGLVPATRLSYMLDIPMLAIKWSTRDHKERFISDGVYEFLRNEEKNILLVEDIVDSGETFTQLFDFLGKSNYDRACLVYNKSQPHICDYYHIKIDRNEMPQWIDFWWDQRKD